MRTFDLCVTATLCAFLLSASLLAVEQPNELFAGPEYAKAFTNPKDDPALPNVLLIGDSISIGYTIDVRKVLKGKADVFRIPENGRYAEYGDQHLDKWLKDPGVKWDVIHFNWGLWDICYRDSQSKEKGGRDKVRGVIQAKPEQYQEHLSKAVAKLSATGAVLIWCATTPVPENEVGRKVGDEVAYNAIAKNLMDQHHIRINDLYAHAAKRTPEIFVGPGDVHFTSQGSVYLAEQVAREITAAMAKP